MTNAVADRPNRHRLTEAVEEVHAAAKALGIEVDGELYTPWRIRAEAWLYRAERLLGHLACDG